MILNEIYNWQIETIDGEIFDQFDKNKKEQTWKRINDLNSIIRYSFISKSPLLSNHHIYCTDGIRFIKRFGKGFIKSTSHGFQLMEYVNCCMTNQFRAWVFSSNGVMVITHNRYNLRI